MSGITYHRGKKEAISGLRGIIWDLDNTLYRVDRVMEDAFHYAVARAVIEAGVNLPFKQAADMAHQSFVKYGHSGRVFIDRYGLDPHKLHFSYHGYIDETVIVKSIEQRDLFTSLPLQHVLVTHSARSWAVRVLSHLGLSQWFPADRVLAFEDYDFKAKHQHSTGFDAALEKLELDAGNVAVIEDMLPNLEIPHKMGMTTIYVRHGVKLDPPPGFVHLSCDSTVDALREIESLKKAA
jgi:putative hydrolase of the HAD superfamily